MALQGANEALKVILNKWDTWNKMVHLIIRALLEPHNALFFKTIFIQGQIHKSTNIASPLQDLEESAR